MKTDLAFGIQANDCTVRAWRRSEWRRSITTAALGLVFLFGWSGCQAPPTPLPTGDSVQSEVQTIRQGDTVKVSFPGAPNLDTAQQVRRDGRITLEFVGDVVAAGLTSEELQKDLVQRYSSQLVSKEVTVTITSATFPVFVTGAVLKPGRLVSDHPITVLEAVMEAGGFEPTKADTEGVVVIRQEGGSTKNYTVNLKLVLEGKSNTSFYLQPSDIVYVPEKFSWF
jgi:polysaccharide biosynthesis/export protein